MDTKFSKFYDVIVAKEYETRQNGQSETKTAWNRIGRAWPSRSGESLSFELYLMPNQRYVINLRDRNAEQAKPSEEAPF